MRAAGQSPCTEPEPGQAAGQGARHGRRQRTAAQQRGGGGGLSLSRESQMPRGVQGPHLDAAHAQKQ
jgi:hypothetical protein